MKLEKDSSTGTLNEIRERFFHRNFKQAEAEVVPSSSSVKLESDLVGLRFVKFILD